MVKTLKRSCVPLLLVAVCLQLAQAQQQTPPPTTNPTSPVAPVAPAAPSSGPVKQDQPASPVMGSSPTVTGILAPSVGETGDTHSEMTGGLLFSEVFDSNYQNLSGSLGWNELSTIGGHMEIHRVGASTDLMIRYVGGGYIDPQNSSFDSSYHQLEMSEALQFRRWSLNLDDVFSYLPEAAFGFGGNGLTGGTGVGITIVNPFVVPNQSILTNLGKRVSNTALAQAQIEVSPRSALTFTGTYSLLHFTDSSNLDSTDTAFRMGYNYQLSPRDVIGVSYGFSAIRFNPALQSINDNSIQVTYGRHLTDRLALQAGVGPELYTNTPLIGTSLGVQTSWGANASLAYQLGHTSLAAGFARGVSGGSGVIAGATSTGVRFNASRQFGQWTTVTGAVGYASNASLPLAATPTTSYTGVNASAGVSRKLSRSFSVNVNYNFNHQGTNAAPCTGVGCASPFLAHQIYVGFTWDIRPIALR